MPGPTCHDPCENRDDAAPARPARPDQLLSRRRIVALAGTLAAGFALDAITLGIYGHVTPSMGREAGAALSASLFG